MKTGEGESAAISGVIGKSREQFSGRTIIQSLGDAQLGDVWQRRIW